MRTAQRLLFSLLFTALGACGRDNPNFEGSAGLEDDSSLLRFEPSSFELYRGQSFGFDVISRGVSVLSTLDVLTVEPGGVVSLAEPGTGLALAAGEAELIAKNDGVEARAQVKVLAAELGAISVNPNPVRVRSGDTVALRVTGQLSDGGTIDLTPTALGTSYESALLTVDGRGVATGLAPGEGVLVVRHAAFQARVDVIVEPGGNPLTKLEIIPSFVTLREGESQQLQVVGTLEDGTRIDLTQGELGTTYRSSANQVARVTGNGLVRARGPGFAEITTLNSGLTAVAVIEVPGLEEIVGLEIRPDDFFLRAGERASFQILGRLASGGFVTLNGAPELVLDIGDARVARIEGQDTLVARNAGETLFSASFRGWTDQALVRVGADEELIELRIEPNPIIMPTGGVGSYSVLAFFRSGELRNVTFEPQTRQFTNDASIAVLVSPGQLVGAQPGFTTLQVSYRNFQAVARVLVEEVVSQYVDISIIAPSVMIAGENAILFVLGVRSDGSFDDITFDPNVVLWSDRPTVVSVQPGSVQASSAGVATITATYQGLLRTKQIRVNQGPDPVISLVWVPSSLTLSINQSASARLIATFASGATANVTLDPNLQGSLNGPVGVAPGNEEIIVTALGPGFGELIATYQGVTAVLDVFIDVQVVNLILNFPPTIAQGSTAPYSVLAEFADGRVVDVTFDPALSINVSPPGLLDVAFGLLTGRSPGVVVVEVFYQGAVNTTRVRVTPPSAPISRIEFRPSSLSLAPGQGQVVDLVAIRADGTEFSIANDPSVNLVSSPGVGAFVVPGAIQVENFGVMQGSVSAFYQNLQATLTINGGPMPILVGIRLNPNPMVIGVGERARVEVIGIFSDGSESPITSGLSFSSANPMIASVSGGAVTGVSPGNTEVRVTESSGGFSEVLSVTVTNAQIVGLRVEPNAVTIGVGDSITLTVFGVFADGTEILLTSGVTFQSFNPNIASVNAQGTVTGLQVGFAFITMVGPNGLNQTVLVSVVGGSIPQLFSVNPNAIAVGSPNTTIIVTGQGFAQGDQIVVGLTPIQTTISGPNQLQAVIPSNLLTSEGTLQIRLVRISSGAFSNALPILVGSPPRLLNFTPTQIALGATIRVTITGTGLSQLTFTSTRLRISNPSEDGTGTRAEVTLTAPPNIPVGPAEVRISNPFGSVIMLIDVLGLAGSDLVVSNGQTVFLSGTNTFDDVTVETGGRIVAQGNVPLIISASGSITVRGRIEANGQDGAPGFQDAARGGNAGAGGGGGGAGGDGNSPTGAPGGVGAPNGQASGPGQGAGTPGGDGGGFGSGDGARFQCGAGGGGGALGGSGGNGGGDMGIGTGGAGGSANGASSDQGGGTGGGGGTTCGGNSGGGGGGGGGVIVLETTLGGTIQVDGVIEARGGRGGNGFQGTGGGGGGSGGLVALLAETGAVIVNDTLRVTGGGGGDSDFTGTGGGGGGGFIVIISPMVNTAGGVFDTAGGAPGASLGGGAPGLAGQPGQFLLNP